MKFEIGDSVRVMDFAELQHIHDFKSVRLNQPIKYFSLKMIIYFGSVGTVTDCVRDSEGVEFYRITNDGGENAWDGSLLRVE